MRRNITTLTEILMLLYWVFASALAFDLIKIDPALMYSDYENPLVVAWNWSFFPLDVAFAGLGLSARFLNLSASSSEKLEAIAATLMLCAGLMAISFWVFTGDFNFTWWAVNIWLLGLGLTNLIFGSNDARPSA